METLSYKALEAQGYSGYLLRDAPEKVLQFGEGNFLRAFVDYWFDVSNEKAGWNGKCVLVQPIPQGLASLINRQEGLYTLYLRGRQNGKKVDRTRVISSVSRCLDPYEAEDYAAMMALAVSDDLEYVVSNTTEAGIVYDPACKPDDAPPASFPAKLTQVLYARWQAGLSHSLLRADRQQRQGITPMREPVYRPVGPGTRIPHLGYGGVHLLLHPGGPHRPRSGEGPDRGRRHGSRQRLSG